MEFVGKEVQIFQEQTKYEIRGRMGAEETIVRGVDSSAIDMAKHDIEYEEDRRNNQHREVHKAGYGKARSSGWQSCFDLGAVDSVVKQIANTTLTSTGPESDDVHFGTAV